MPLVVRRPEGPCSLRRLLRARHRLDHLSINLVGGGGLKEGGVGVVEVERDHLAVRPAHARVVGSGARLPQAIWGLSWSFATPPWIPANMAKLSRFKTLWSTEKDRE
jgi:hypothetical protein